MSPSYLYHYTSSEGIEGIKSDGVIKSSTDIWGDAFMGEGVYLTSLGPSTNVEYLVKNNWDGGPEEYSAKRSYLEYFIRFRQEDLPHARRLNDDRNIWLVPHDIFLEDVPHFIGKRRKPQNRQDSEPDSEQYSEQDVEQDIEQYIEQYSEQDSEQDIELYCGQDSEQDIDLFWEQDSEQDIDLYWEQDSEEDIELYCE